MTKDEFATYFRALQAHDYETFKKYYTPDYRAHFDGQTFDREGVIAVERKLAEIADSSWDIIDVVADENGIAVHAFLDMRFRKDAPPGFALGAFKADERVRKRFCGFYKLRGGKICEFRVFPFLGESSTDEAPSPTFGST